MESGLGTTESICMVDLFNYRLSGSPFYVSLTLRFFAEPTNNVAPKKDLERFEGWKVVLVAPSETAWLTCLVTGYPVPRYM